MKSVIALALGVLAVLAGPFVVDAWEAERTHRQLFEQEISHRRRADPLIAAEAHREKEADRYPELATALALGKPLSGSLYLVSDLAARSGLTFTTLSVAPAVLLEPARLLLGEHRVRVLVTGPERSVHRFVQTLAEIAAPLRVEAARLSGGPAARLELDLRVLVETAER